MLAGLGLVTAGEETGEPRRGAGFDDQAQNVPQFALRSPDVVVRDQKRVGDVGLNEREAVRADACGAKRIRGEAFGPDIDGLTGGEGTVERRAAFGLDRDDTCAAGIPGGNARDEAAAANAHQDRVEVRGLRLEL